MQKVMIFGSTGRLGKRFVEHYTTRAVLSLPTRPGLDLAGFDSVGHFILEKKPELIINCSAMNGLENCIADPFSAEMVNAIAPYQMARAAALCGATFVHFSTDYAVSQQYQFTLITEKTEAPAASIYGKTKRNGERAVLRGRPTNALVLRVSSLYDSADMAGSLDAVRQVRAGKGTEENPVKVLRQLASPVSTRYVVRQTVSLLEKLSGEIPFESLLVQIAPRFPIWKVEFAKKAVEFFIGHAQSQSVVIRSGELEIPRPVLSGLSSDFMAEILNQSPPSPQALLWEEAEMWDSESHARSGTSAGHRA